MIEVITEKKEWNLLLEEVDAYDFYTTYDYHQLSNTNGHKPQLIKYVQDDTIIALPILMRNIDNTPYFDATSVYGYAGPISKNIPKNFDNQRFKNALGDYFSANQIVSVFSRLNPYLPHQKTVLGNIGEIKEKGDIVMIDLNQSLEEQRAQYQKRIKSQINSARNLCRIKKAETDDDIAAFMDLYYENMRRVDAKKSYYFDDNYFYKFSHNDHSKIEILLAMLAETGEVISGAMFIKTNDIIQYHLSGIKTDYLDIAAVKMLIDEMRIKGTNENYKIFNLGGGLNSKNDSLLRFKKSFSKKVDQFSVWQFIVNESIYNELVSSSKNEDPDFFPQYRHPI